MVAWPVCRPKDLEGLGVPDLKLTNIALALKREVALWLQHTDTQRAWSQLPSMHPSFKAGFGVLQCFSLHHTWQRATTNF
jgi:hypothetical protein